jgi:hypothetical protein
VATVEASAAKGRTGAVAGLARRGGEVALLALAALLAARAAYFLWMNLVISVPWPFENVVGEATMLAESQLLERDRLEGLRALYGPQPEDRFIAGNYPPLYLLLWALKPGPSAFPTGRALSLLGGLLAAAAGAAAVYAALPGARPARLAAALLGPAAFICTVPVFQWMGVAKPDLVALGLAACGLALFELAPGRRFPTALSAGPPPERREGSLPAPPAARSAALRAAGRPPAGAAGSGTVAAGVCFALALLTKQSVGFALAAALVAALRRGPRALLTLGLAVAGTLAAALGALWLLAGPSLFEHLVLYNLRDWSRGQFALATTKFLALHWPLLVPALAYAAWGLRARPRSALTYYPLTALPALATVGAEGAGPGYYGELCLAAGLGAALALGTLLGARPAPALGVVVLGAVVLALAGFYAFRAYTVFIPSAYGPAPPPQVRIDYQNQLLALVDAAPDPVLLEQGGFLAMRGRAPVVDDAWLGQVLRRAGRWDDGGIVAGLRERRYSLVVVRNAEERALRDKWGDAFVDALLANYDRPGPDAIFYPKGR